jgi:outer membrane protein
VKLHGLSISCVLVLALSAAPACAGQTMTLDQCIKTGLENNPSLKASMFKVDSAGYDINTARADLLPAVTSSYSASAIFRNQATGPSQQDYLNQNIHAFNIKLTQILFAGSRIVNTIEKAKILQQAADADMNLARLELMYNIESTFFRMMKARQDLISATESVSRLTESVKSAEAFARKELVPYVDVLKARVDLADAENQLGIARNNENRMRVALLSLLDLPMDPSIEFVDEEYAPVKENPSFESSFHYALENRPDLKSLAYQCDAANKQVAIATGKSLPVVRFDAGYYEQNNDYQNQQQTISGPYDIDQTNKYLMAGFTVSWDLFDGGRAFSEKEKFAVEAKKIGALLRDARNMLSTGIRKALYSMSEASERLASSADALVAAKENYTSEEKRLKAGISTIQTLLEAQGRLIRAEGNRSNAVLDYQLAKSELKLMTGGEKLENDPK